MKKATSFKQLTVFVLSAALVISLAACGDKAPTGLKIGIVTSSGIDDGALGKNCYMGIRDYVDVTPGATDTHVKEPDVGKVVQAAADIIADYDVMICPGFQFAAMGPLAVANPDKNFLLIDAAPVDENGKRVVLDNVYSMMFKEEEGGFFAGVIAALETKTNKVAVVTGIAFPSNVNYQFGFMSGVNYANEHMGTSAEVVDIPSYSGTDSNGTNVGGNYVGDFSDQATGKIVGEALIKEGVDILLVVAGDSGSGVFAAAKEAPGEVFVIGGDIDMYDEGVVDGRNIVLTSVTKNIRLNITRQLEAVGNDSFKGENAILGADSDSTGFIKADGRQQLSAETITKTDEVVVLVKEGKIQPASNFSDFTPTDFPGLK